MWESVSNAFLKSKAAHQTCKPHSHIQWHKPLASQSSSMVKKIIKACKSKIIKIRLPQKWNKILKILPQTIWSWSTKMNFSNFSKSNSNSCHRSKQLLLNQWCQDTKDKASSQLFSFPHQKLSSKKSKLTSPEPTPLLIDQVTSQSTMTKQNPRPDLKSFKHQSKPPSSPWTSLRMMIQ